MDFLHDRIYVFTPNGDIKDLPEGATPVDFAYAIHSEVGHGITGARVNGRIVTLNRALQSGDMVEVLKTKNKRPSWDWLTFVQTTNARRLIRSWFKRNDPSIAVADGKKALNAELARAGSSTEKLSREQVNILLTMFSERTLDDLMTTISMGGIDAADVVKKLYPDAHKPAPRMQTARNVSRPEESVEHLIIGGQAGLGHRIGKCCAPIQGTPVTGYITRTSGVTVHAVGCANIRNADSRRILEATWT